MASPPKVDALLFCDFVRKDPATGKHMLLGVWDAIWAASYPAICDEFGVYVSLTGLNGTYVLDLLLLGPDLEVVTTLSTPITVHAQDPLVRHELGLSVSGMEFDRPGRYTVRLRYNQLLAAEVSLDAKLTSTP